MFEKALVQGCAEHMGVVLEQAAFSLADLVCGQAQRLTVKARHLRVGAIKPGQIFLGYQCVQRALRQCMCLEGTQAGRVSLMQFVQKRQGIGQLAQFLVQVAQVFGDFSQRQ